MQFGGGGFSHDSFDILVPFVRTVLLGEFDLGHVVVANVRRQSGQGLPSGSADTDEESVTPRLLDDTSDLRQMLDREPTRD